jgi:uncharacterized protein YukE
VADLIQMDYDAVMEMAKIAKNTSEELEELVSQLNAIVDEMEGGVLMGRGGRAICDGLRERLAPATSRLSAKFGEINGDLLGALSDLRDSDQEAGGRFG